MRTIHLKIHGRFMLGIFVLSSLTPAKLPAQTKSPDTTIRYNALRSQQFDHHQYLASRAQEFVDSPQEVHRTPVFDNAPFLHLKQGDKLVKGHHWHERAKVIKPHFEAKDSYFLLSSGKYYELGAFGPQPKNEFDPPSNDVEEKLNLSEVTLSLLFDWDVTLKAATQLKSIYSSDLGRPLSMKEYRAIRAALKDKFAENIREDTLEEVHDPYIVGTGKAKRAVFDGLGYDAGWNTIYRYRLEIGNNVFRQMRRNLIIGPPQVETWEFGEYEPGDTPNSMALSHPDAQTAARKRAAYERMQEFQRLVESCLPPRPSTVYSGAGFGGG